MPSTHPHPHPLPLRGRGDFVGALKLASPLYREAGEGEGEGEGEGGVVSGGASVVSPAGSHTDALIVFMPSGKRGRFPLGTPVLKAARSLGVDIDSVCGGRGICGRCQVEVSEGEFAKLGVTSKAANLSAFGAVEQRYADRRGLKDGRRLSCSSLLQGDLVIDVPPDSQVHKQVVRKRAEMRAIELDPVVRLHYVEVIEPNMHDPSGDLQRLMQALAAQWGLTGLDCDLRVIQHLQKALRQGNWTVTVAVHHGKQITAVWPGFHDKAYGLAFDVGSTTTIAISSPAAVYL